jgi:mRNA-degrading endonuclease RelE of RelBE toxin-antitoxin system
MNYKVLTIPPFDRQVKRLSKKYPSLKSDLAVLGSKLAENPTLGKPIGHDCYKIRMAISSKGKGKSAGARVITHIYVAQTAIYLLTIYDKSEKTDISEAELKDLLTNI